MAKDNSWKKICEQTEMLNHDFSVSPFEFIASEIKKACQDFEKNGEKGPRILCKQDTRDSHLQFFKNKGLYILPKRKGYILKGEGSDIVTPIQTYYKKLDFELESSEIGDSEMQHIDYAYANSLIKTFMEDESLLLTIRKYTPSFSCVASGFKLNISIVQTEDAGYEGKDKIVLIEAKNSENTDTIIRQFKTVYPLFFEKRKRRRENLLHLTI